MTFTQNAENPVNQGPKSQVKGPSGYIADVTTANELKVALSGSIVIPTQTVSEGPTGASVPADATYEGGRGPTGNLTGISVDASGNQNMRLLDSAGTNVASVSAAGAVKVDGSAATQPVSQAGSSTAGACAQTAVSNSSGSILASNASRKEAIVVNTGTTVIFLGLGQTPTATAYHVALSACSVANDGTGGVYVTDIWTGGINAIAAVSGTVVVTELT